MKTFRSFIVLALLGLFFTACSDNVDESNLYVFKGKSAYKFLESTEDLSNYAYLLSRVQISKKSPSRFSELLSARGKLYGFCSHQ